MEPAGNYVTVVDNGEANFWSTLDQMEQRGGAENAAGFRSLYAGALKRYVLNGGIIENRRQESIRLDYSKEWVVKSTQGFRGEIAVTLQRAVADTDVCEDVRDSEGNPVTQTIIGFRAEMMRRYSAFTGLLRYDDAGREYIYRVRETAVTANGIEADMGENGGYFTVGDYEFTIDYSDDINRITNTQVGETEFQIRKRWEPALEEGAEVSIVVQLYRDGVAYAPAKNVILPEGAERNADGTLTLTGGGDGAAWLLKGLPKYESIGVKYIYTAREIACAPSVYRLADQYYTTEELCVELKNGVEVIHDVITCVFTNAHEGGGRILTFEVEKKWLDDNDLLHRGAVTVQLYYVKQGAGDVAECVAVEDATVVLDSRNQWFSMLYHMPSVAYDSDSPEWDVSNYFLREISISDSGAEGGQARVEYTGSELQGECTTTEHIYAVSNEYEILDQHSAAVTVTNLRKGTVNMEITKAWNVGGMKQIDKEDMTAWFTVYQNDREFRTVPMSITGNGNTLYIRDLPKYDEYGALYSYTLQESGLNNLEFEDGVIDWSDFRIVSSGSVREYEAGEHHTNDWMRASFTNTRVASSEIIVNKVWRDDGTDAVYEKRPDIVLTLYRQSVDEDGHPLKDASGAEIEPELGDGLETRYAQTTVYGMADSRWMVDLRHLAVGVPGTQHGAYSENGAAVPLNVQADGSFAAEVALTLAGCIETLTISGRVEVLKRDSYGNPRQISLTVNGLPANLDVGILFTAVRILSDIPQTGDMLAAALAIGGICLAALILLAVLHRKRRS